MKVSYTTLDEDKTVAYLDDEPIAKGIYSGTNKHSDEPIRVRKDEEGNFFQIPIPELADHQKFTNNGYQLICECGAVTSDWSMHYNEVIKGEQK